MKLAENICNQFHIRSGSLLLACDNEAAGYSITQTNFPTPRQNDFDLLQAISRTKRSLPILLSYKHVEGHQSTKYPGQTLDKWASLNEEMDSLAKAHLSYSESYPNLDDTIDTKEWAV